MKRLFLIFAILIVFLSCSQPDQSSEYVNIPDESLAKLIRRELILEISEPIPEKSLKELTELRIQWSDPRIKDLKGLEKATGLKTLLIYDTHHINDIRPLTNLKNLTKLGIYGVTVRNIKPLTGLTQLTYLGLNYNYLKDISPIVNLKNLTELYIGENPITDITPLKELTQLEKLSLGHNHLSNIKPLANLTKLTKLILFDNHISDISSLSGLTNLTELKILHNKVKDISPLAGLTNLTTLELHNSFSDISPLAGLTNLVNLELYANRITDITALSKLTQLTELRLEDNLISDISPLAGLTNLTTLRLHKNQITDITPLSGMTKLQLLELHRNKIRDVAPITQMTQLKELFLSGNEISDISPLAGLTELTHLGLAHNYIKDISVVQNFKFLEHLSLKQNPVRDFAPLHTLRQQILELHLPTQKFYGKRENSHLDSIFNRHETRDGLPIGTIARLGKGGINVMLFSPDGTQLVVGTDIGVRIYDVATGKEKDVPRTINAQINALTFSHDGHILASGGSSNPVIQLWDMQTGKEFPPLPVTVNNYVNSQPIHSISALVFSPDNTTLISLNGNGLVNHWDVTTSNNMPKLEIYTYGAWNEVFAINTNGKTFAVGSADGKIELWNTSGGEIGNWSITKLKQTKPAATLKGHSRIFGNFKLFGNKNKRSVHPKIMTLAFSPDGKTLASGSKDMTVRLWNTERRKKLKTLKGHVGWITALAFSNDGKIIASGDTDSIVRLWDTHKGNELAILNGHKNTIVALTFAPNGKTLASASADGTIRFWDANTGTEISIFATGHTESVKAVAFSADGATLSSAMFNGTVQQYDIKTGQELTPFTTGHQKMTYAVVLSPDATLLATHGADGIIAFNSKGLKTDEKYSSNRDQNEIRFWNLNTGEQFPSLTQIKDFVFSPNSYVIAGRNYEETRIWDVRKGVEIFRIITSNDTVLFSPNGNILVTGDTFESGEIWDIKTQRLLATLPSHNDPVAFSPDSHVLATIKSYDLHLWDLTLPTEPQNLGGIELHGPHDKTMIFSPNGTILLEVEDRLYEWFCNTRIHLWSVETGEKLHTLVGHTEPIETLVFSPDGKTLASGSEDGTVLLWDWDEILTDVMLENRLMNDR